jgi:hypothetical protein
MMKRLEGSEMIPPLEKDEVEEEINSKDWIIRRALGQRIAVHGEKAFDFDRVKGTEEKSQRAYL